MLEGFGVEENRQQKSLMARGTSGLIGIWGNLLERVKGIEPSYEAWEAAVLPLNYTRLL